jgi:hypothetical protein
MNTKKFLVNTPQTKVSAPELCQQALGQQRHHPSLETAACNEQGQNQAYSLHMSVS